MKQVKMICLGAGARGMYAYAPYAKTFPDRLKFVAVADPVEARRTAFAQEYGVPKSAVFASWQEALRAGIAADAVLVATQDREHVDPACAAMEAGYDVLMEKPVSHLPQECIRVRETALRTGRQAVVCHVLRYTVFFSKLRELIESGAIGDLVSVAHNENIGYWHMAHSYVRGNWRDIEKSSPIILAKSCHDIDILLYLIGSRCTRVASFGNLKHFRKEHRPAGAAMCCLDCACEPDCPYSAVRLYMDPARTEWPVTVITEDLTEAGRRRALREGPYGRCVYECDNTAPDHQSTILAFENGVTATFNLCAFTDQESSRTIRIMGTRGELRAALVGDKIELTDFVSNTTQRIDISGAVQNEYAHGGGDFGLIDAFVRMEQTGAPVKTSIEESIESHLICMAAEKARLENCVVDMDAFTT